MGTKATLRTEMWWDGVEYDLRMGKKYIYTPNDWVKLAVGDPLPEQIGRKAAYILHVAWPVGCMFGVYDFDMAVVRTAIRALGWTKESKPINEFILVMYMDSKGDDVMFTMPHCPVFAQKGVVIHINKNLEPQEA